MTRLEVRKYGNKKYCKNLFHVFEILELSFIVNFAIISIYSPSELMSLIFWLTNLVIL